MLACVRACVPCLACGVTIFFPSHTWPLAPYKVSLSDKIKAKRLAAIAAAVTADERELAAEIEGDDAAPTTAAPAIKTHAAGKDSQRRPRVKKTPVGGSRGGQIIVQHGVVKQRVYKMTPADIAQRKMWK